MAGLTGASVTLRIEIIDEQAMWRHAYAGFEQINGTADQADFEDMCGTEQAPDICGCLRMIFDSGESPPGLQIDDSSPEIVAPAWDERYPHFTDDRGELGTDGFGGEQD